MPSKIGAHEFDARGVDDDARTHRRETRVWTDDDFVSSFAAIRDETTARGGVTTMGVSRGGSGRPRG